MAKTKTVFYCQHCGAQHAKWLGQCSTCKSWNTIVEEIVQKQEKVAWKDDTAPKNKQVAKPLKISEIDSSKDIRLNTGDNEFNQVLGGGLVPGSLTLLGGEPGIGKSTLMLQIALTWGHGSVNVMPSTNSITSIFLILLSLK